MLVFLNGRFVPEAHALIPVNDRGFLLGDGLFETMRVANGRPFRFAQHLDRLERGAEFLKIKLPFTRHELETFAAQLIERNQAPEAILRLTLTRGPGGRGYAPSSDNQPTVVMALHPAIGAPGTVPASCKNVSGHVETVLGAPVGWKLITSSFRIPVGDPMAAFKTTSKILHVIARAEAAERGADEALLLNTNGGAAETAGGNLFWVQEEAVCTVPATGILPGITRAVVLEICRTLGIQTDQRAIRPDELKLRAGIFITQSALGIVPVMMFDGAPIAPSLLVDQISHAYREMLLRP